jgi:HSP20 family protein
MDRTFGRVFRDIGFPGGGLWSRRATHGGQRLWAPRVEAFQQGDRFIVRAELPGLKKDDVQVELTDEALTIRGERRSEQQEEREGVYLTEREYGEFYRVVPLPEGVIGESAQATFKDGLLEITLQAPPEEANRGRRLEIQEASGSNQRDKR